MTSFAHQAAQIDAAALARYLEARAAGLPGADRGREDSHRPVEPDLHPRQPERPLRAAQEAAGPAAEERPRGRPRISRHEGRSRATDVPVPRMLLLCEDDSVIGTAFFVMEFVDGTVFWDPALPELSQGPARQGLRRAEPGAGRAAFGRSRQGRASPTSARPGSYFARQRDRWTKQYRASETEHVEDMETADRVAGDRTSRPTTAASRWCTATIASTT